MTPLPTWRFCSLRLWLVFGLSIRNVPPPMGEYRSYLRRDYPSETTSVLVWLISAMVAGFCLQNILLRWMDADVALTRYLLLSAPNLRELRLWTLLSYSFFHDPNNLLHIIFAVLSLYFTGRDLLVRLSPRRFLGLFAALSVVGGLAWAAVHWRSSGILLGSSAAVYGLIVLWVCFDPDRQISILLLFIPVTLPKAKYLIYGLVFIDLCGFAFSEIIGRGSPVSIAHSAHLAGMAAAWVYFRIAHGDAFSFHLPWLRSRSKVEPPAWSRKPGSRPAPSDYHVNHSNRDVLRAEIDRILDKINSAGFGSLTPEEKRTLDEARDLLNKR
jgi:membrane associated rhomboid family serine protease